MQIPEPRGPLSASLRDCLVGRRRAPAAPVGRGGDPLADDDLQLALFVVHELSYGGLDGVHDDWEFDPSLIGFRATLEEAMLDALFGRVGPPRPYPPADVSGEILALIDSDDGPPLARFIEKTGGLDQFREFVIHRSAYQLKEADPHTFGIPRITGAAKAAMVEIQADEYGGGDAERMHSALFATTMRELDLDPTYGAYVALLPASTLTTVNLISLFGLRRRWRGALVGHLAGFEITSPQPNRRYANGLRRLGLRAEATEFFDEHVEADSVHENIAAYDLAGGLARQEPALAGDILFGVRALLFCESRFAQHILDSWERGESSLIGDDATRTAA
jgi:Iron-containing redox enzyme